MEKVFVRLQNLPWKVNGFTILDADGDYNVYINARLSQDGQRKAYRHELRHIRRGDFYNDLPIRKAEDT